MLRIVADLGNSRLKWARLDEEGRLTPSSALPPDDPLAWDKLWDAWHENQRQPSRWAIASVNPPVAQRLAAFLQGRHVRQATWYQTAADVPIEMDVEGADTGGADRALAVLAARAHLPPGQPGLVGAAPDVMVRIDDRLHQRILLTSSSTASAISRGASCGSACPA